jgi:hypothetical protein
MTGDRAPSVFVVARNPQDDSKLPYLLRLPLEGGSRAAAPAVEPRPKSGFMTPTGSLRGVLFVLVVSGSEGRP